MDSILRALRRPEWPQQPQRCSSAPKARSARERLCWVLIQTWSPACCYSPRRRLDSFARSQKVHGGRARAKDYYTWLEAKYSKAFYVGESRASGGRQDLEFEASVAVYVSRPHYANVLEAMLADPQHRNILETSARPRRAFRGKKTSSSSTITSLNPDGSGRTESRFRVPTRAPRDRRSLGARLDDGKIPGFQCRPLI